MNSMMTLTMMIMILYSPLNPSKIKQDHNKITYNK